MQAVTIFITMPSEKYIQELIYIYILYIIYIQQKQPIGDQKIFKKMKHLKVLHLYLSFPH